MKKAFISIYVLLILLVFGITISFVHKENETNFDTSQALYNKKISMYEAESFLNILVGEEGLVEETKDTELLGIFDHKSELKIYRGDSAAAINEGRVAKVITIKAIYKDTVSRAVLTYELDKNNKAQILYKRVF